MFLSTVRRYILYIYPGDSHVYVFNKEKKSHGKHTPCGRPTEALTCIWNITRLFSRPEHGLNNLSMLGQSQMEIYSIYIHTHIYMYIHIPIITLILLMWFHRVVVSMLGSRERVQFPKEPQSAVNTTIYPKSGINEV